MISLNSLLLYIVLAELKYNYKLIKYLINNKTIINAYALVFRMLNAYSYYFLYTQTYMYIYSYVNVYVIHNSVYRKVYSDTILNTVICCGSMVSHSVIWCAIVCNCV